MPNSNLAYKAGYSYRESDNERKVQNITNKRTAGGIMIKTERSKNKKVNTVNSATRKKNHVARSTVVMGAILCGMAFLVLFRGLMITSGYQKLEEKNILLSETIAENQKIQFKIDQTLDLKNIENIAKNTFGMGAPTKSQTIYINLDQTDEVKKVKGSGSVIEAVKNFFGSIVEYFA